MARPGVNRGVHLYRHTNTFNVHDNLFGSPVFKNIIVYKQK